MRPQCNVGELRIEGPGRRKVVARFDGGRMSSDGSAVLLREADRIVGVTAKLASCFTDFRDPARVEHDLEALVAQRVYALAPGYEDLNDHDVLRDDSVLALALGKEDITGAMRSRSRDLGHPLAGSTTLNRLEPSDDATAAAHRYKRIVADGAALDAQLVALFVAMQATAPAEIVLDLDATDARCTAPRRGASYTATTAATAICRSTSTAATTFCAGACGRRMSIPRRARSTRLPRWCSRSVRTGPGSPFPSPCTLPPRRRRSPRADYARRRSRTRSRRPATHLVREMSRRRPAQQATPGTSSCVPRPPHSPTTHLRQ